MKVYVLYVGMEHESGSIWGVYSSLDLAISEKNKSEWKKGFDYAEIHETIIDSGDVIEVK